MPVVINEFEVMAEAPNQQTPEAAQPEARPAPPAAARELERVAHHLTERAIRVWAG